MEDEQIQVEINISLDDMENAIKEAEDSAWDHAKQSAEVLGIEMGDDEFGMIYQELSKRYVHNVEHLQFFMATALLLLKSFFENEYVTMFIDNEQLTEEEIAKRISVLANSLVNSYMWIAAGYELTWLSNDELPEKINVKFKFNQDNVIIEEDNYGIDI